MKTSLIGVAAAAMVSAVSPVYAQSASDAETVASEEIVVTARKRAENLQEVPLSITALSAERIESAGIDNLRDVAALTPGMTFDDLAAGLFATPTLRGLSQANVFGPRNVATFIDGVYISDSAGVDIGVIDLERVEVVKGPQSALYGRNSFSGAINYVTRRPSEDFEAFGKADLGSDDRFRAQLSASGPLIGDVLSARISFVHDRYDGTWRGRGNDALFAGHEKTGGTLALQFNPREGTELRYRLYIADDKLGPSPIGRQESNCAINAFGVAQYFCGVMPDGDNVQIERPTSPVLIGTEREIEYHSLNFEQALGSLTLSAIAGYNIVDIASVNTSDRTASGIPFPLVATTAPLFLPTASLGTALVRTYTSQYSDTEERSFELRLASDQGEIFRWSFGGFYFDSKFNNANPITLDVSGVPAGRRIGAFSSANGGVIGGVSSAVALWSVSTPDTLSGVPSSRSVTDVIQRSIFAQAELQPIEPLTIRGEVRQTQEKRAVDILFQATTPPAGGRPLAPTFGRFGRTWEYTNYRVGADYQLTEDILAYASVATGENAGGFNTGATVASDFAFNPETNTTYEIGTKTQFLDRRLTANAAIFYVDWKDAQINGPPSAGSASPVNVVRNIGAIESQGIEVEFSAILSEMFTLSGGFAFNDAQWGEGSYDTNGGAVIATGADPAVTGAQGGAVLACLQIPTCRPRVTTIATSNPALRQTAINIEGLRTVRTAKETWNLALDAETPLTGDWTGFGRVSYSHQGPQVFTINNLIKGGPRDIVDANLGVRNESVTVMVYVENALDELSPTNALFNPNLNDFRNRFDPIYTNGRLYGVSLKVAY